MNRKLLEYSVIYTNRAVNLMSEEFQSCMRELNTNLCKIYHAKKCALIPGSGTTAMESVARQFGNNKDCMIIRNGFFSYRWSQIFEKGNIAKSTSVINGNISDSNKISPPDLNIVVENIIQNKPALFCAPHVETSTGVMLSQHYIKTVATAVRENGGLFCLDGIASGTMWVDMEDMNIDIYITAPQKGWSSPASCGVVMMGERAVSMLEETESSSFTLDLKKWVDVGNAYDNGGFMYHCTVPTDAMMEFNDNVKETLEFGIEEAEKQAQLLGNKFRHLLESNGYPSVADDDCKSPTVVVSYTNSDTVNQLKNNGIMVAGYVPFMIDEPEDLRTFRIGLFGIDKLYDIDHTFELFKKALDVKEEAVDNIKYL